MSSQQEIPKVKY